MLVVILVIFIRNRSAKRKESRKYCVNGGLTPIDDDRDNHVGNVNQVRVSVRMDDEDAHVNIQIIEVTTKHRIPVTELHSVIEEKHRNDGFLKEYGKLPKDVVLSHVEASKKRNKKKNRCLDTLSYDHSRVVIHGNPASDYINANYIDSYTAEKAYIATGESDCLIKTKHCDGRNLVLTQCDFCPVL